MLLRGIVLFTCLLLVTVSSFGLFSRPSPLTRDVIRPPKPKPGSLKLCPPGGASFVDAFNLICPMRRRRRDVSSVEEQEGSQMVPTRHSRKMMTMGETMHICCSEGCTFSDILPLCNPFN